MMYSPSSNKHVRSPRRKMLDDIFPIPIFLLRIAGFWAPLSLEYRHWAAYRIYTIFSLTSVMALITFTLMHCVLSGGDVSILLLQNIYLVISFLNCVSKTLNLLVKRASVVRLLEMYVDDRWSNLKDRKELAIIKRSRSAERFLVVFCLLLIGANGLLRMLGPILNDNPEHKLMIDSYSLCDRSRAICFTLSYFYQCFGFGIVNLIHMAHDCLMYNFIDRICAYFKILSHRLCKLPKLIGAIEEHRNGGVGNAENIYLVGCAKDHQSILALIDELNNTFHDVITIQLVSSIIVICTNIFFLSMLELFSPDFMAVFVYLCCVLVQNFFYCWYGYKLSENSLSVLEAVANMDWYILQTKTKKVLLFMMLMMSYKIEPFTNAVFELTPESFIKILKLSYSIFTVLQRTSHKVVEIDRT